MCPPTVPPGFEPDRRSGPFLDLVGPLWELPAGGPGGLLIGLPIDERHLNARGFAHGGLLATLADILLGRTAALAAVRPSPPVTVSLTTDFVGAARAGDWLEGSAVVTRAGSTLTFVRGALTAGGRPVLDASGIYLGRRPKREPS